VDKKIIMYHATPVNKVDSIIRNGLRPSQGFVYLARTPQSAWEQGYDAQFERGEAPTEMAIIGVSIDPSDLYKPEPEQWEMDEDLATRKVIPASQILGVVKQK
jgi:hypothetical protein